MSSSPKASALDLDLERDLPVTEEDVAVLRRLHLDVALSPEEYGRLLAQFGHASIEELRRRPVFRGPAFEL